MEEFFRKIEVKTKEDLPQKEMIIYGKYKNSVKIEAIEFHKDDLGWGLANIDWYFLPIYKEELQGDICLYPKIDRK
jgi:hypothetical protein